MNNTMNNSLSARTHSAGRHQVLGKILYSFGNILFIRFKFLASRSFRHISLIPGKWLIFWKYTKWLNIFTMRTLSNLLSLFGFYKTFCKSCLVWIIIYYILHTLHLLKKFIRKHSSLWTCKRYVMNTEYCGVRTWYFFISMTRSRATE